MAAALLLLTSCSALITAEHPRANDGVLDLTEWDFDRDGAVRLDGEWLFYWSRFLDPDADAGRLPEPTALSNVPQPWRTIPNAEDAGIKLHGYATYALRVRLNPEVSEFLGIRTRDQGAAYRLYVNGRFVGQRGRPSPNLSEMVPRWRPIVTEPIPSDDELLILVHVSSRHHRWSGLWNPLFLGRHDHVQAMRTNAVGRTLFLAGAVLIMGLYHVVVYLFRRKEPFALHFSLICALLFVRTLVADEFLLVEYLPWITYGAARRIEYLTAYLAMPLFYTFFRAVFPHEFHPKSVQVTRAMSVPFVVSLVLPVRWFSLGMPIFYAFAIPTVLYAIVCMARAVVRRRQGAGWYFAGTLFLGLTIIHDMLYLALIIDSTFLAPVGIFVFVFSHSGILAGRFSRAFNAVEELSTELTETNQSLERRVLERTRDLQQANARMQDSIEYGRVIQHALLPGSEEFSRWFSDFLVHWSPRDVVGGDFYQLKESAAGVYLIVGDCTGHGVSGALMTMLANSAINHVFEHLYGFTPSYILQKLHQELHGVFEHRRENAYELDEGMDVAVVLFERSGGRARFAGANLGMFLARERSVELIRGDRFGIGYRRTPGDYEFRDHTIELTPSTRLYLASDGIETQMGAVERRAYGREQMVNVLRSTLDQPMEEQKRALIENVTTFMGAAARRDDVCLVGVEPRTQ